MKKALKLISYVLPPLLVALILLYVFHGSALYPFGDNSISWCDMNQQVVPLLCDFKDILEGQQSLFLNLQNSGGMNFFGVFFFFLASPFSLLVKFVDKSNMILFVNILVLLKCMTASVTAMVYFRKCHKKLSPAMAGMLSVMYSLSGFMLLFYQNLIWLDMVYILPLLVLSLNVLVKKQNNIPYIIAISAMLVVNYYISYMMVLFIFLFMGAYLLSKTHKENKKAVCTSFITGSFIGAMLTAVVWLPCLLQYFSSGRGKSIFDTIESSNFLTPYKTIFPLLYCTAFVFVVVGVYLLSARKGRKISRSRLFMFGMMLIPFLIEPINLMWHTGNYMSFPARYGFITVFVGLICCAEYFESEPVVKGEKDSVLGIAASCLILVFYALFAKNYITENFKDLSHYTETLWGNDSSFLKLTELFIVTFISYCLLLILLRRKKLLKDIFIVFAGLIMIVEAVGNTTIYMTGQAIDTDVSVENFQNAMEAQNDYSDDDFYRVNTNLKIMDSNLVGALGYNSLSHYTSLTDKDYMFNQKMLGYSSVWMEVGSFGGTELTNALYNVKYTMRKSGNTYFKEEYPYYLGLGLVCETDFTNLGDLPENMCRADVQQYLFSSIFNTDEKLITKYDYAENESNGISYSQEKYEINNGASINYTIDCKGSQTLYADCFDALTNNLSEPYFESLSIVVNGSVDNSSYPTSNMNGVIKLGEFCDETVEISISCKKSISVYSFGVFGLDTDLLETTLGSAGSADLNVSDGKIVGSYYCEKASSCVLSIPYQQGFTVKVNGEKVGYKKALGDFLVFDLVQGDNDIEISYLPKGFVAGTLISFAGVALLVAYLLLKKKISQQGSINTVSYYVTAGVTIIAGIAVYIFPVVLTFASYIFYQT